MKQTGSPSDRSFFFRSIGWEIEPTDSARVWWSASSAYWRPRGIKIIIDRILIWHVILLVVNPSDICIELSIHVGCDQLCTHFKFHELPLSELLASCEINFFNGFVIHSPQTIHYYHDNIRFISSMILQLRYINLQLF